MDNTKLCSVHNPDPSPGDIPDPGIKLGSPALHTDSLPTEPLGKPSTFLSEDLDEEIKDLVQAEALQAQLLMQEEAQAPL